MFMRDHAADFPVNVMCETLGVSRSGYYANTSRAESARAAADQALAAEIRTAHAASRGRYGSPRVHAPNACPRSPCWPQAGRARDARHGLGGAPQAPDRVWLADLTCIWTAEGWLHCADRGVQFAAHRYRARWLAQGMLCAMSRKGDCWDNAPMESFFATLKGELIEGADCQRRNQTRADVFHGIEGFCGRRRLHAALGQITPEHKAAAFHSAAQAA